ncbi:MAG: helix-turn-helix domain-containing protein [Actinomycetota bacterium]|nr:helix-turn-helix domain-containing protein [Actinomycetota bacterium]
MVQTSRRTDSCSIQGTLDVIGDRWILLILRDLFRGVRRFSQLEENLGIAKNLLATRLAKLVQADIVTKIPYQDRPVRHEYLLTQKGRDLSPSLVALMRWGDRWHNDKKPPTLLVHSDCGTPLTQLTQCPACGDSLDPAEIRSRPGPGAAISS